MAFDTSAEADRVLTELARFQKEYLADPDDAVIAIRQPDSKVNLKQSISMVGVGAASGGLFGAVWSTLVGLLTPDFAGAAVQVRRLPAHSHAAQARR